MTGNVTSRVLSIQSHVVSGYVGNRAAVFPLQLLGYDVDILNSCSLANHTGYKHGASGIRFKGEDLTQLICGMKENGLLSQLTHILTGYIGSVSFLEAVVDTVQQIRDHKNEDVVFVCDPVLGDNGKLYVPEELIYVYTDKVLRHATILTPNSFELSLLTGMSIESEVDAFAACDKLHKTHGIKTIFTTGVRAKRDEKKVSVLTSSIRDEQHVRFAVDADFIDGTFTGTGDLMSALLLAWTNKLPDDLEGACMHAMASVTGVLHRTMEMPKSEGHCTFRELRLIQSQNEIFNPPLNLVRSRRAFL